MSPVRVLNAFRHQRENHYLECTVTTEEGRCSTPFGIRGKITSIGLERYRLAKAGAQRLSASEGKSQCFIPFNPVAPVVLNAFRHQRENHRTSAAPGILILTSAQRLSASEGKSLSQKVSFETVRQVLNAFRHQRENHRGLLKNSVC